MTRNVSGALFNFGSFGITPPALSIDLNMFENLWTILIKTSIITKFRAKLILKELGGYNSPNYKEID